MSDAKNRGNTGLIVMQTLKESTLIKRKLEMGQRDRLQKRAGYKGERSAKKQNVRKEVKNKRAPKQGESI